MSHLYLSEAEKWPLVKSVFSSSSGSLRMSAPAALASAKVCRIVAIHLAGSQYATLGSWSPAVISSAG